MGNKASLLYSRPKHQSAPSPRPESSASSTIISFFEPESETDKAGSISSSTRHAGIPPALSFDRIVHGGTCPPCTLRDFMNFLVYIEHSAENLQFFLWLRDYDRRFRSATTSDIGLSPEWTREQSEEIFAQLRRDKAQLRAREPEAGTQLFNGTDFETKRPTQNASNSALVDPTANPFSTPPVTPSNTTEHESVFTTHSSNATCAETINTQVSEVFSKAGIRQPFTIQPFREEVNRIIATYIAEGAPRQLNLSGPDRLVTLKALSQTTHPTAFAVVFKTADTALRRQAHPNFLRWSICNGNRPRVLFARCLGVALIIISTLVAIALTIANVGRGYRALAAIGWVLGISTLIAAWKGMCVVLHGMHHHHVRPWELFVGDEMDEKRSFDSFGTANSYEDEPWIAKYNKRNIVRKIFDRELWVQEPALRHIQDLIFWQAMVCAVFIAGLLTVLFVLVPGWQHK